MQFRSRPLESVPAPVPHSESDALSADLETNMSADELDRLSLLDECHREQMARRALEELFAAGEMAAFEY